MRITEKDLTTLQYRPDIIIGIDPDTILSGVAILDKTTKSLELRSLSFAKVIDLLIWICGQDKKILVCVEAGWLNEGNWHLRRGDSSRIAAAKGKAVGANHDVGKRIVEMCEHWGVTTEKVRPLHKCWKGASRKITHEEFCEVTGYKGRTNQETRDAGLIAWNRAGFPIRIRVSR